MIPGEHFAQPSDPSRGELSPRRKWILRSFLSPGDILMLTAAVRDLHRCCPDQFLTDVRTSCSALWQNNPYLTPLDEGEPEVNVLDCHYPLIHQSSQSARHFIHGYIEFLNEQLPLSTPIRLSAFKGDLHLSEAEKAAPSLVGKLAGEEIPYWIVAAGGKYDYTIKWWQCQRYQAVIDYFRDRLLFVQVGAREHFHPELRGVLDLRGQTDLRQLIQLVNRGQGVLCGVTFLMHLAAALEKPSVVVAGGRESPHWEAYPAHQFVHTVGALSCCAQGGCWRARTLPLHDGDENDRPQALCVDVVNGLPRCMDLITPEDVIRRLELYLRAGAVRRLTSQECALAARVVKPTLRALIGL